MSSDNGGSTCKLLEILRNEGRPDLRQTSVSEPVTVTISDCQWLLLQIQPTTGYTPS